MAWEIHYYARVNGKSPYDDWFGSLDATVQSYIVGTLDRMAENEHLGGCPPIRHGNGLRESRFHSHGGWRICLIQESNRIIIFWGGKKEDQIRDIERAKGYLAEYRE